MMYRLDPRIKGIWILKNLLLSIIVSMGVLFYELIRLFRFDDAIFFIHGFVAFMVFIGMGIIGIVFPFLSYYYWKYEIRDNELYIERGVLTKIRTVAPRTRIQHLDVSQGVFERMFGLARLVIYTAGSRGADIIIPGLEVEFADKLRDDLKNVQNEDIL